MVPGQRFAPGFASSIATLQEWLFGWNCRLSGTSEDNQLCGIPFLHRTPNRNRFGHVEWGEHTRPNKSIKNWDTIEYSIPFEMWKRWFWANGLAAFCLAFLVANFFWLCWQVRPFQFTLKVNYFMQSAGVYNFFLFLSHWPNFHFNRTRFLPTLYRHWPLVLLLPIFVCTFWGLQCDAIRKKVE